ncbi:MAG: BrnA antitoxin family protein [Desulfamplus sp.]|nr:BrnA antitoxin family protein [Desulfamplus sp.]MBF0389830.1 BrnA antitoxin family protein [Desulfamplus sp.]
MKSDSLKKTSKTDWKALESMSDDDIDYSDIPQLPEEWFKNAKVRTPPSIFVKVDSDVLDWFKSHGGDYQHQINSILRNYIKANA